MHTALRAILSHGVAGVAPLSEAGTEPDSDREGLRMASPNLLCIWGWVLILNERVHRLGFSMASYNKMNPQEHKAIAALASNLLNRVSS